MSKIKISKTKLIQMQTNRHAENKDCPSGKLNKKKFVEVYKQFYPTGKAEKFCEYIFRAFDNDSSGSI
ncbi:unnamed protein product, partial [Rotaria magnacalcarata]